MKMDDLVKMAREAQSQAYAPYSQFRVGAALLTNDDRVFTGANIENASYGMSICAERTAVFKAVLAGHKKFQAIAIAGSGTGYIYPCGACLQVLTEFSSDMKIITVNENDEYREYYLGDLLPQSFKFAQALIE